MDRETALKLIKKYIKTKNLVKHLLATEAVMKALAIRFNEDPEVWGLAGLVHDIDYDLTKDCFSKHGKMGAEILANQGIDEEILHAVRAHSGNEEPKSIMAKALCCTDPLTGFLVACALITPVKKLNVIDVAFVLNRFKEKRFAAGADRKMIIKCEEIGFPLDEFIEIGLKAMQDINKDIGL